MIRLRVDDKDKPITLAGITQSGPIKVSGPSLREQQQAQQRQIMNMYNQGKINDQQVGAMSYANVFNGVPSGLKLNSVSQYQGGNRGTFGSILKPAVGTFSNMILKTPANTASYLGTGLDAIGADWVGEKLKNYGDRTAQGLDAFTGASQFTTQAQRGENPLLVNVGSGFGSLAASATLARLGGKPGSAGFNWTAPAVFGLNTAGEQSRLARQAGVSEGRAFLTGTGAGVTEALLERIMPEGESMAFWKGAFKEGLEESLQGLATTIISDLGYTDVDYSDALKEAAYEGLIGAIVGGGSQSITNTISRMPQIAQEVKTQVATKAKQVQLDSFMSTKVNELGVDTVQGHLSSLNDYFQHRQGQNKGRAAELNATIARARQAGKDLGINVLNNNLQQLQSDIQAAIQSFDRVLQSPSAQGGFIAGPGATDFENQKQAGRVFEGVDGKPRFEVDDSGARLKDIESAIKNNKPKSNKGELQKLRSEAAQLQAVNPFDRRIGEIRKEIEQLQSGGTPKAKPTKLADVLDHSELFKQYPELASVEFEMRSLPGKNAEAIVDGYGRTKIVLDSKTYKNDTEYAKKTLLHEIQHAIQNKEGFAGGSSETNFDLYNRSAGEAEARAVAARMNMSDGERYNIPMGQRYFHGTAKGNNFQSFDIEKANTGVGSNALHQGAAIYLTNNKEAADYFSKQATRNAKLRDRNLSLEEATGGEDVSGEVYEVVLSDDAKVKKLNKRPTIEEANRLRENGYDAIQFPEEALQAIEGRSKDIKADTIAVFNPQKVQVITPQSTFYDSLDVPKEDLIIRDGSGKAMSIDTNTQAYADFLEQAEPNDGVVINPDNSRSSTHSPFYRETFAKKKRKPTKAEWLAEAERQIRAGEAPAEFTQEAPTTNITSDGQADQVIKSMREEANRPLRIRQDQTLQSQTEQTGANRQQQALRVNNQKQQSQSQVRVGELNKVSPYRDTTLDRLSSQEAEQELLREIEEFTTRDDSVAKGPGKKANNLVAQIANDKKITNATIKAQQEGQQFNFFARKAKDGRSVGVEAFDPKRHEIQAGFVTDKDGNILGNHIRIDETGIAVNVGGELVNMSQIMGDISQWKNHYAMTETMDRNLERAAPDKATYKRVRRFLIDHKIKQEAAFRQELNSERAKLGAQNKEVLAARPSEVSKEEYKADIFDYIEGNITQLDMKSRYGESEKIITEFKESTRDLYNRLLDRVNEEFIRFGEAPVEKRKDYITHINELTQKPSYAGEMFGRLQNSMLGEGQQTTRGSVPTEIAGRTENFEPRKRWNPYFQRRKGGDFSKDPFAAIDAYIEPTLYNIHMTESAVRARSIEAAFRAAQSVQEMNRADVSDVFKEKLDQLKEKNNLSKVVTGMQEYANALAGKTQRWDRQVVDASDASAFGLRTWQQLQRIGGQATILGNAQSVLSQTLNTPAMIADVGAQNALKGVARYVSGDKTIEQSNFVTARETDASSPFKSNFEKGKNLAGKPLQWTENQMIEITWYSEYEQALEQGFTGQEAIMEADRRTERVVAGRGIADRPEAYRSTLVNGVLQYTLEVQAQNRLFWQDLNTTQKGKYFMGTFVMNSIMGAITGFEPLPDLIQATIDTFKDFTDDDEEDDRGVLDKMVSAGQRVAGEYAEMNPLVTAGANVLPQDTRRKLFGDESSLGRFDGQAAPIQVVQRGIDAVTDTAKGDYKGARDNVLRILPGGNQVRKTLTGAELLDKGYQENSSGNVQYLAPDTLAGKAKTLLFGPYSNNNAREYFDASRTPLSEKQSESFKLMNKYDQEGFYNQVQDKRVEDRQNQAIRIQQKENLEAGGGVQTPTEGGLSDRADKLREDASLLSSSLTELREQNNLPDSVNTYEKLAAHLSGDYEDFVEAYGLRPDEPKQATGQFSGLIEKNRGSEMISKAKELYNGYEDVPDEIKDQFYKEAGVTREEIEYDIAAGFKVADKADYLANNLRGMPYAQRIQTLYEFMKPSITGEYFASYGTIDELADMGVISEDDAKELKRLKYDEKTNKFVDKYGSSGGSSKGKKISLKGLMPSGTVTTANDIRIAFDKVTPTGTGGGAPGDYKKLIRIARA